MVILTKILHTQELKSNRHIFHCLVSFTQSNVPVSASYQTFQYPVLLGGTNCNVSIYSGAPTPIPRSSQVVPIVMSRSSRGNQLRYLVLLRWYQLQYLALLRDMKCISRSFQGYQLQCLAPLRDMKCNTSFFSGIPTCSTSTTNSCGGFHALTTVHISTPLPFACCRQERARCTLLPRPSSERLAWASVSKRGHR